MSSSTKTIKLPRDNNPVVTLETIPAELDANGWNLETDRTDIQVYTRKGACNSRILGFKTITEHPVTAVTAYNLLRDVIKAMELVNDQYTHGENFGEWPTDDVTGHLVRTSFAMPFPFSNREFLHGLHSKEIAEGVYIVGYTPEPGVDIAVQKGFKRSDISISGQRITALPWGGCRVEHLMVYELGGNVSPGVQDSLLKGGHVGAYVKEWRNLRRTLYPTMLEDVNADLLKGLASHLLEQSKHWPTVKSGTEGKVSTGRSTFCPNTMYRLESETALPAAKVAEVIGYKSLDYLPQWNVEFKEGEVLQEIAASGTLTRQLVRVRYSAPFFLDDREYLYYFSTEKLSDDEYLILYQSVKSDMPVADGVTRSILYPTVHHIKAANGKTTITHILATDLGGNLGSKQDGLLKGGLISAQQRDLKNQAKLFAKLA